MTVLTLSGPAIDAAVPLALLESVRALDLPPPTSTPNSCTSCATSGSACDTVYHQIRRYQSRCAGSNRCRTTRCSRWPGSSDVVLMRTLSFVRPDGWLRAGSTLSAALRRASRSLPRPWDVRWRSVRHGACWRDASSVAPSSGREARCCSTLPAGDGDAAPHAAGCGFFEAALREPVAGLTGDDLRYSRSRVAREAMRHANGEPTGGADLF